MCRCYGHVGGCVTHDRDVVISWGSGWRATHIWMPAELLEHRVVKVAGIAQEATGNVVGVLHALHDLVDDGRTRPLSELKLPLLCRDVQVVDPRMVGSGIVVVHMVLELDNVAVRNVLSIHRLDYWSLGYLPDAEQRARSSRRCETEQSAGLHDVGGGKV